MDPTTRLAGIPFPRGQGVDALLGAVGETLAARGFRLAGVVQEAAVLPNGCCGPMILRDVGGLASVRISQDLGAEAAGCRLDPQALAGVAGRLEEVVAQGGLDFLLLNRFGKSEADGGGLRSVIGAALAADIPVLVGVRSDFTEAFAAFHGGLGATLPADPGVVLAWAEAVAGAMRSAA